MGIGRVDKKSAKAGGHRKPGANRFRPAAAALLLAALMSDGAQAAKALLLLRPAGRHFEEVVDGLRRNIEGEFDILEQLVDTGTRVADVEAWMGRNRPELVVLMDNRVINLYKRYQTPLPDSMVAPSISVMALSLEKEIRGLRRASGIGYEVPIVTSALNLRGIIGKPLHKIGIVHREFLGGFVAANAGHCQREGMRIAAVSLGNKEEDFRKSVKTALERLLEDEKVDALWVPNDNVLLSPEIIRKVWLPMIGRHKKPVIVGVETLVNPGLGFGTFAVLPDHAELGRQLAEQILETPVPGSVNGSVDQPLSVIKVVNFPQARKFLGVGKDRLGSVDRVLE